MAARRRRMSRSTSRARGQNGRERLWVQSTLGNISVAEQSSGTYAGQLITPGDWERELQGVTQVPSRAGGPRLEAMYLSVAVNLSDDAQFAPVLPELLVFSQSSQFANIVTGSTAFVSTFQTQRVLMYDPTSLRDAYFWPNNELIQAQYAAHNWHLKSKCRLSEVDINIAVRLSVDVTAFTEASVQVAFRAYLSLP